MFSDDKFYSLKFNTEKDVQKDHIKVRPTQTLIFPRKKGQQQQKNYNKIGLFS